MRIALLIILACLFLAAPPAMRPILCLGVAFVMSAALVEMLRDHKRSTQRRSMLSLQIRGHASSFASARKINAHRFGSVTGCFL